jgi:hypothetical protein
MFGFAGTHTVAPMPLSYEPPSLEASLGPPPPLEASTESAATATAFNAPVFDDPDRVETLANPLSAMTAAAPANSLPALADSSLLGPQLVSAAQPGVGLAPAAQQALSIQVSVSAGATSDLSGQAINLTDGVANAQEKDVAAKMFKKKQQKANKRPSNYPIVKNIVRYGGIGCLVLLLVAVIWMVKTTMDQEADQQCLFLCNQRGTCKNDTACNCDMQPDNTPYEGARCEFSNQLTCNGNGVVQSDGTCTNCNTGYSGEHCAPIPAQTIIPSAETSVWSVTRKPSGVANPPTAKHGVYSRTVGDSDDIAIWPGARWGSLSWTYRHDTYLFGGIGCGRDANSGCGDGLALETGSYRYFSSIIGTKAHYLEDMWRYRSQDLLRLQERSMFPQGQFSYMTGDDTHKESGGVEHASPAAWVGTPTALGYDCDLAQGCIDNVWPGKRALGAAWTVGAAGDQAVLFGGQVCIDCIMSNPNSGSVEYLNDLWKTYLGVSIQRWHRQSPPPGSPGRPPNGYPAVGLGGRGDYTRPVNNNWRPGWPGARAGTSTWTATTTQGETIAYIFGGVGYDMGDYSSPSRVKGDPSALQPLYCWCTDDTYMWRDLAGYINELWKEHNGFQLYTPPSGFAIQARTQAVVWQPPSGSSSQYMFGGIGQTGAYGDLWQINEEAQWPTAGPFSFVSGQGGPNVVAVRPNMCASPPCAGIPSPGSRYGASAWYAPGKLWLFGGRGVDNSPGSSCNPAPASSITHKCGYLSDTWSFDTATRVWRLEAGTVPINQGGVYTQSRHMTAALNPGSRFGAVSWVDSSNTAWMWGGLGYESSHQQEAATGGARHSSLLRSYSRC